MQLYVSGMEYPPPPPFPPSLSLSRLDFYSTYFARRQWYGFPCYVEKEKVSKMGKGGARTGKGRFEGSGETDTSFEESGKGTCIFIISSLFDSWSRGSILWILIFSFIFFFSSCMSWRSLSIFFFTGMHDELVYDSLSVCCISLVFSIVITNCRITARYARWIIQKMSLRLKKWFSWSATIYIYYICIMVRVIDRIFSVYLVERVNDNLDCLVSRWKKKKKKIHDLTFLERRSISNTRNREKRAIRSIRFFCFFALLFPLCVHVCLRSRCTTARCTEGAGIKTRMK